MTEDEMRDAGLARKARSIAKLKEKGVPVIDHLPRIECDPARLQHSESIARRTTVIALLAVYSEEKGMPREVLTRLLRERGVEPDLTPAEVKYLAARGKRHVSARINLDVRLRSGLRKSALFGELTASIDATRSKRSPRACKWA